MITKLRHKAKEILLWSQQYTKIDMLYITRSGFWVTLSYVIGTILSFILTLAFANLLPKETYGLYKYVLSILGILSVFTLSGMTQATIRAVARGKDKILKSAAYFQLRWSFPFIIITNSVALYYWLRGNHIISISLFILSLSTPLIQSFDAYAAFLTGKKDFRLSTILDSLGGTISSLGLVIALFFTKNLLVIIAAYAILNVAATIIPYWITARKYKSSDQEELDRETITYGTSLSFLSAAGVLVQQLDKVLIFKFAGSVELATYAIASALPDRLKSFIKSSVAMVFPKLAQKNIDDFKHTIKIRVWQGMAIGLCLTTTYFLAAPILFKIFLPKYLSAVRYSQLLSLSTVLLVPTFFLGYAFESQKLIKSIYSINITSVATRVGLYFVLGYFWGPIGIVWARVISNVFLFFIHLLFWYIESNYLLWAKIKTN